MRRGRCNCGADAHHEHLLARGNTSGRGGQMSILGGSSVALNGFVRRPEVRAWNYALQPTTANGVHNVFSTTTTTQSRPANNNSTEQNPQTETMAQMVDSSNRELQNNSNNNNNSTLQEDSSSESATTTTTDGHQHPAAAVSQNLVSSNNTHSQQPSTSSSPAPSSRRVFAQGSGGGGSAFPDDPSYQTLRSDADQELLIYCPFSEFLNIRAMMVVCNPSTCPPAEEPSAVQLFINRQDAHLGFSDVRRAAPAQSVKLGSSAAPGDSIIYALDSGRFRSVSSISMFFKTSYGGENTQVSRVVFFGESTREPVFRDIARNVVTEQMADPAEHVRRIQAEGNVRTVKN